MNENNQPLPQVLYVATPERKKSYQWDEGAKKLDPKVKVVDREDIGKLEATFPKAYNEGEVLMLHPFEDATYINVAEIENIKDAKFYAYAEIAQQLGATGYKATYTRKETEKLMESFDGKVGFKKIFGAEVKTNSDEISGIGGSFSLSASFNGVSVVSKESYEKAKDLVRRYNLETDTMINSLIRKRDPANENLQYSETIHCELTKEINKGLDVAVSLNAVKILALDTSFQRSTEFREVVELDIEFFFCN